MASSRSSAARSNETTMNGIDQLLSPPFDLIDYDDEKGVDSNDSEKWARLEDEWMTGYTFDNTVPNLQEWDDNEAEEENLLLIDDHDHWLADVNDDDDDDEEEETVLSQQLNQLNTESNDDENEPSIHGKRRPRANLTTVESTAKKFRNSTDKTDDSIPEYLSSTNKLLDRAINQALPNLSSDEMKAIRQMAFFIHKIKGFTLLLELWSTYLNAGPEQLEASAHVDRRFWPAHVTSVLEKQKNIQSSSITEEELVNEHVRDYREAIIKYQTQFDEGKTLLARRWTTTVEETIHRFVYKHGLAALDMKCHLKQALARYQYDDEIWQRRYRQEEPTEYQESLAQHLYDTEVKLETVKSDLKEYQQRIICNHPPTRYDCLQISLPSTIKSLSNRDLRQQLLNRYEQLVQRTKTDLIAIDIHSQQTLVHQYQTQFNNGTQLMWQHYRQKRPDKYLTESFLALINQRSINLQKKMRALSDFTIRYHIRSSYGQRDNIKKGKERHNFKRIGFISHLLVDPIVTSKSLLTKRHMRLLNRGPTYIPPGQLHVSSRLRTIDEMLLRQYAPLRHQLAATFQRFHIDISRSANFQKQAYESFKELFSVTLPDQLYRRALYERQLIQSIRLTLVKNNLILRRTADQSNVFCLSDHTNFNRLSDEYMDSNVDRFQILFSVDGANEDNVREQIKKRFQLMNDELDKLFREKRFSAEVHKNLRAKTDHCIMPYLYFLPDISVTTTSSAQVVPMIVAHRSATARLGQYLRQVLRPLLARYLHRTTFVNDADFVRKLDQYAGADRRLHPTTLFATIQVINFEAMASHRSVSNALVHFLSDYLPTNRVHYTSIRTMNRTQSVTIETLQKLTEIYLENNIFYYNGKIYRCVQGGPNSLRFSELLSNVYLYAYEKTLCSDPRLSNELYGRHKNRMFFTWNRSHDELVTLLETLTQQHPHVRIETQLGRSVHFLHAHVENRHGHLYTCVHHADHLPTLKYALPYVIGDIKTMHSCWLRSALMRAVRLCNNYLDFLQEQTYLQVACLLSGYSSDFIEGQLKHFYVRFNAEKLRFDLDQPAYDRLRRRLFDIVDQQLRLVDRNHTLEDTEHLLQYSYAYDYGSQHQFNRKFHELWLTYLREDPQLSHKDTKVVMNCRQIYTLNALLARQKPSHAFAKIAPKDTL